MAKSCVSGYRKKASCLDDDKSTLLNVESDSVLWAKGISKRTPSSTVTVRDLLQINRINLNNGDIRTMKTRSRSAAPAVEMYRAYRDCLEPRTRFGDLATEWRADLISYSGCATPDGGSCRSIGHWNPSDQLEVFETIEGMVVMVVVLPAGGVDIVRCMPGYSIVIPRGAFHLTYAPQPSRVINIYNSRKSPKFEEKYGNGLDVPEIELMFDQGLWLRTRAKSGCIWRQDVSESPIRWCRRLPHGVRDLHAMDDALFSIAIEDTQALG